MLYESVHKCIYCTHVFNCTKVYKHIYAVHLCVLQLYKSVHKGICCTKVCASVHAAKKCKQVYILDINIVYAAQKSAQVCSIPCHSDFSLIVSLDLSRYRPTPHLSSTISIKYIFIPLLECAIPAAPTLSVTQIRVTSILAVFLKTWSTGSLKI